MEMDLWLIEYRYGKSKTKIDHMIFANDYQSVLKNIHKYTEGQRENDKANTTKC